MNNLGGRGLCEENLLVGEIQQHHQAVPLSLWFSDCKASHLTKTDTLSYKKNAKANHQKYI